MALVWLVPACGGADPAARKAEAVRRGDEFVAEGRDREAIAAYRAALAADSRDGRVRLKLARALYRNQEWAAASTEGIRAADLLPDDREATLFGIEMMLSVGRFPDASSRSAELLREHPNDVDLLVMHANATARQLNATWALWRLDEAMRANLDLDRVRRELRPPTLAAEDEAAEAEIRRALAIDPRHVQARFALVNLLWMTGRLADSEPILRALADELPTHWLANRSLGLLYRSMQRERDAEQYLRTATKHGDPDAGTILVDFLLMQGRREHALEVADQLAAEEDADGAAAARAADIVVQLGRVSDANQRLDATLQKFPRQARALRLKAALLLGANDHLQALETARAAVAADGRSAEAHALLGRALEASGDVTGAFEAFSQAHWLEPDTAGVRTTLARLGIVLGRYRKAAEHAEAALMLNPADTEAAILHARALVELGEHAEASEVLRPLLTRAPQAARVWTLEGVVRAARRQPAAARAAFQRALQLDPGDIEALAGLIDLELAAGATREASRRVENALAAHPRFPAYLHLRGRVAEASGDRAAAEQAFREVLSVEPGHADAAVQLARLLRGGGRTDEAVAVLTATVERAPSSVDAALALAELLEANGRQADAQVRYEAILTAHPREPRSSVRLARILADDNGRLDAALTLARQAKEALPADAEVSGVLGWIYLRKELPALAVPHLRDALAAAPDQGTYAFHLGLAYQRLNQRDEAARTFTRAVALAPAAPWIAEARAALASLSR